MDDIPSFSVLSFVPIQSWSSSNLNVSRTLPPCLFSMPERGTEGSASFTPFFPGNASSGFPLSNTFLCIFSLLDDVSAFFGRLLLLLELSRRRGRRYREHIVQR